MPVFFKIKGERFSFPEGWQDVTLEKYLLYLEHVEMKTPSKLRDLQLSTDKSRPDALAAIDQLYYAQEIVPHFLRYFCFFTGVPLDMAKHIKQDRLESMYRGIEQNLAKSLEKLDAYNPTIEHAGKVWYLPEKYMSKSTVIEFIEAAQFEHYAKQVEDNQFKALPKLLCVLLKEEKGEEYNSDNNPARERLFLSMTMDKVWRVCFFLQILNARFQKDLAIYTAAQAVRSLSVQA